MFYWENTSKYPFNPNKRYLIYFVGAFSLPHRGHFSVIRDFLYKSNVKILISHIRSRERHGISSQLSTKIWEIYIRDLVPYKEKVSLIKRCCNLEVTKHRFTKDVDTVIYIRGDEGFSRSGVERKMTEQFRDVSTALQGMGKSMDFYYTERPLLNVLSSSKFIADVKRKEHVRGRNRFYRDLRFYLPRGLPRSEIVYILNRVSDEI